MVQSFFASTSADPAPSSSNPSAPNSLQATGIYITIHGHFYQPPRENPYLEAVEHQPSASPFHDWNERIYHECYRPNAFARIFNDRGDVIDIVNNYEYLSFNIGPTLFSWLERYDLEVYQRIIAADRASCQRLNSHGNAIAQVYNHIILPLANHQDKVTQIRWGKADFQQRFGREPEGMWLAEAAVDYPTLEVLIQEGIKFIVLAPSQALRCRPRPSSNNPDPAWYEVAGCQIDPNRPYRCFLPAGNQETDFIDVFFYDGPISRDMGFSDLLNSSQFLAGRLGQAVRHDHRELQLISVATDGETFGHHKKDAEKALAYALKVEFPQRGWQVSNYAHYLSLQSPTWEVVLKPVTAWSCAHGVDRWQADCGCGGGGAWHQRWRQPLRESLNWLRDELTDIYETLAAEFFTDGWAARNAYIEVIQDRSPERLEKFFQAWQQHSLTANERVDALRLLEMQRYGLLMFTSCGWFFEEISRPEGVQILRYAARALELAADVSGVQLEAEFSQRLAAAPSNVEAFGNGAGVYQQLVKSSQISLQQVAAHYGMNSLFTNYPTQHHLYCYDIVQNDYLRQQMGNLTLAIGQITLTSDVTRESQALVMAVLHMGGWDFHCCLKPFQGRADYAETKACLLNALQQGSTAKVLLTLTQAFGETAYGLNDLFAEDRHRLMHALTQTTLNRLDQLYSQVYRDNYGILMGFQRDGLAVPQELQVAASVALTHQAKAALKSVEQELADPQNLPSSNLPQYLIQLEAIAEEARVLGCSLNLGPESQHLEQQILQVLWHLFHNCDPDRLIALVPLLSQIMIIAHRLHLDLNLEPMQELYFQTLKTLFTPAGDHSLLLTLTPKATHYLLQLGPLLQVDVSWISTCLR
ncbi:DUF3536 domain-containing protein [Thermosynechococcaceae cyanobacterium BACA0444]|uniref:DUF3536 domain-containing protein n=1 Tax=Pseudocalidococcus azoricus BACA0444 TaxID=2918990 RepID=A0AAE4JUT8_9CYAN|nr:DUF3536 domain-containing protein [Pseudocalidococcus azoricus]MDS3859376.1 DUF3536 domain-containing protein [Pseudocalidococcus azoricus BACA0444]